MPKRSRENTEEESIETGNVDTGDFSDGDSAGEEDENTEKYNVMNEDDIEGQEDPTQEFEGDVQITPFNMKEEMEEGHFDKQGTYIFGKRDKDEVKDHWLDNIDWVKVNNQTQAEKDKDEDMDEILDEIKPFNSIASYKEILTIINPGESILKALKRLGGKKTLTASERWKKKKETGETNPQNNVDKEKISQLTELTDTILSKTGNMDVYQETYEGIRFKVQQAEAASSKEADFDMFGEMFDEKTKSSEGEPTSKKARIDPSIPTNDSEKREDTSVEETQWEFKWENKEDVDIHGPHSTRQMQTWTSENYFENGVWVRRIGQQGDFYSSKRVDFELYL